MMRLLVSVRSVDEALLAEVLHDAVRRHRVLLRFLIVALEPIDEELMLGDLPEDG